MATPTPTLSATAVGLIAVGALVATSGIKDVPVLEVARAVLRTGTVPESDRDTVAEARERVQARRPAAAGGLGGGQPYDGSFGSRIVQAAQAYIGVPYKWGGTSRAGLDCSGLVVVALRDVGVSVPRLNSAAFMVWDGARTVTDGPKTGDLCVWAGHIGIAVTSSTMIDAPTFGRRVEVGSIWRIPPPVIRRVIPPSSSVSTLPGVSER